MRKPPDFLSEATKTEGIRHRTRLLHAPCLMPFAAFSLAFVFVFFISGCGTGSTSDKSLAFVTAVEAEQLVTSGRKGLLSGRDKAVWVDPRTLEDFNAGHISGAIHLPYERVSTDYALLKDHPILIIYGNDYDDVRAHGMSKRLKELLGGADIRTLKGGLRAWQAAGHKLETSSE